MAKQDTKQAEERLENVESALSKTELWIENNQKTLWIILIALLVAAFAIYGITNYKKKRNETAKNLSYPQEINFETQAAQAVDFASYYMENENYATALNGDGEKVGFLDIVNDYGSTKAGKLAAYYAGLCYLKQGDYNNAIEYLKKYTNDDKVLAAMALGLIGDCYLELGPTERRVLLRESLQEEPQRLQHSHVPYQIGHDLRNHGQQRQGLGDLPDLEEGVSVEQRSL